MKLKLEAGNLLLKHHENVPPTIWCRILDVDRASGWTWLIAVPQAKGKFGRKPYLTSPFLAAIEDLANGQLGDLSEVAFGQPSSWLLTDAELDANSSNGKMAPTRRRLSKWKKRRDAGFASIAPLFKGRTVGEVLRARAHIGWCEKRKVELGLSSAERLYRAMNRYFYGMGEINALLPDWDACGAEGRHKIWKKKPGARSEFNAPDGKQPGCVMSHDVRVKLWRGWKKYKKDGESVRTAFAKTNAEFFAEELCWSGQEAKVKLLPESRRPTINQFRTVGLEPAPPDPVAVLRKGLARTTSNQQMRAGLNRGRNLAVGQEGQMDATPCDQSLVSMASRLISVQSPYRTEIIEPTIGYVFGLHIGFENPSMTTASLTLLHAADSKVEFCKRFGIEISEEQWLCRSFRRIRVDNGEMKSQLGLATAEEMQATADFCAAYFWQGKPMIESRNQVGHVRVDHKMPASTKGKQRERGEPDPILGSLLNFEEYMHMYLKEVLWYNNEELVPNLLTVEMRSDNVRPTRASIINWMIEKGYESSPTDVEQLRVRCLPKFKGISCPDGIHIIDPTRSKEAFIPKMIYNSEWLRSQRIRKRNFDIHMNPSLPAEVWVNIGGLKPLHLQVQDPYLLKMPLLDWVGISIDDRKTLRNGTQLDQEHESSKLSTIARMAADAKDEKKVELKNLPKKPTKTAARRGRRKNTEVEKGLTTTLHHPRSMEYIQLAANRADGASSEGHFPPVPSVSSVSSLSSDYDDVMSGIPSL